MGKYGFLIYWVVEWLYRNGVYLVYFIVEMYNFIYIMLVEKVIFEFDIFFNNLWGYELILKNFWCVLFVIYFNNFIKFLIYEFFFF